MPPPYCYEYPRPAVTVDFVIFALVEAALKVLLIRRGREPFAGAWAIPGGFLEIDEPVDTAVRREMREETGLDFQGPISPIGVFSAPGRDPRGRTISLAHATVIRPPLPEVRGEDDAAEASWWEPREKSPLAFDHDAILDAAMIWLEPEIMRGGTGLALLPLEFRNQDTTNLFRALGKSSRAAATWRHRLLREKRIEPIPGQAGRYRTLER